MGARKVRCLPGQENGSSEPYTYLQVQSRDHLDQLFHFIHQETEVALTSVAWLAVVPQSARLSV